MFDLPNRLFRRLVSHALSGAPAAYGVDSPPPKLEKRAPDRLEGYGAARFRKGWLQSANGCVRSLAGQFDDELRKAIQPRKKTKIPMGLKRRLNAASAKTPS